MSARAFDVTTYVLPAEQNVNPTLQPVQANSSVSFELDRFTAITTLVSNLGSIQADQVQGLLYVPSLDPTSNCFNLSAPIIPQNATRRANIPTTSYAAIAIAPWIDTTCTREYLDAVMQDSDFVRGMIFFQANGTATSQPPPVSDPIWNMNDGGQWKSQISFPAYAIPGPIARSLMEELAVYSGNVTTVPNGKALAADFGDGGMPRLYATVIVESGPSLPSLWVFLIIVLGILLAIVTGSSLFMGFVQRRRRQTLRRRVERGEVNLEALGIKKMTVPQTQLDKMPMYVFKGEHATPTNGSNDAAALEVSKLDSTEAPQIIANTPVPAPAPLPDQNGQFFSQTTCTICLDDFVSNETIVRELPCHHLFHVECVDPFLSEHSSACPVCKNSVLPNGFCPEEITNAMVRREQLIRRIQERRGSRGAAGGAANQPSLSNSLPPQQHRLRNNPVPAALVSRFAGLRETVTRRFSPNRNEPHPDSLPTTAPAPNTPTHSPSTTTTPSQQQPVEMLSIPPTHPQPASDNLSSTNVQNASNRTNNRASFLALRSITDPSQRRELARQRAIANLDQEAAAVEQDIVTEERRLPVWRRAIGKVFPGLTG